MIVKAQDCINLIENEIKWCRDNQIGYDARQEMYIKGLEQAKYLIQQMLKVG